MIRSVDVIHRFFAKGLRSSRHHIFDSRVDRLGVGGLYAPRTPIPLGLSESLMARVLLYAAAEELGCRPVCERGFVAESKWIETPEKSGRGRDSILLSSAHHSKNQESRPREV
jgi:hypothetical protein